MKVTAKGQVTVPKNVREQLGIPPETEVDFVIEGRAARMTLVKKPRNRDARSLRVFAGAHIRMTTDEIMASTRGR